MKCLKICIILIVVVTCSCLTTTTKTNMESNFKMSNTKSEAAAGMSIMDFLSNAMTKNNLQSTNQNTRSKTIRKKSHYTNHINNELNYELLSNSTNSTNPAKDLKKRIKDPNILLADDSLLDLFKESWLTITYKKLSNSNVFPTLNLPDFTETWIPTIEGVYERENKMFSPQTQDENHPPTKYSFYVRLSGKNFFYTSTKDDLQVLGSIPLSGMSKSEKYKNPTDNENCFKLFDIPERGIEPSTCRSSLVEV